MQQTLIALALLLSPMLCFGQVRPLTLDSLFDRLDRGGDTIFVVNFWATWCKPCVVELPYFDKLYSRYKDQPLMVVLISLDELQSIDKVRSYINAKGWKPPVYLLDEEKPHEWIDRVDSTWSGAIPATLFVRPRSGKRVFYEREFSWSSLETTFRTFLEGDGK
ncbi:MAG: TlpA family protein disulfide reductase [Candidatus Kapabacteria bacterium]|jgi:thiol-disulfide isomerase/thioredoxin|nr:TlpA family protein disulfide reductase [Candidatus Kapabacteria bacterium]